jgi:hypothetical protein
MFRSRKAEKMKLAEIHKHVEIWSNVVDQVMLWNRICSSDAKRIIVVANTQKSSVAEEIKFCEKLILVNCNEMPFLLQTEKDQLIQHVMLHYRDVMHLEFEDRDDRQILRILFYGFYGL